MIDVSMITMNWAAAISTSARLRRWRSRAVPDAVKGIVSSFSCPSGRCAGDDAEAGCPRAVRVLSADAATRRTAVGQCHAGLSVAWERREHSDGESAGAYGCRSPEWGAAGAYGR